MIWRGRLASAVSIVCATSLIPIRDSVKFCDAFADPVCSFARTAGCGDASDGGSGVMNVCRLERERASDKQIHIQATATGSNAGVGGINRSLPNGYVLWNVYVTACLCVIQSVPTKTRLI